MQAVFARTVLLGLVFLQTTCSTVAGFFVANRTSRPVAVEYSLPCTPCPTPKLVAAKHLRGGSMSQRLGREVARAVVGGRIDSSVTYAVTLPPDTAVRAFDGAVDGGGRVINATGQFAGYRVVVRTSAGVRAYEGHALINALQRYNRTTYVLDITDSVEGSTGLSPRCSESPHLPLASGDASVAMPGFRTVLILDTTRIDSARFLVRMLTTRLDLQPHSAHGQPRAGDSVTIGWHDAFTASTGAVVLESDSLRGWAVNSSFPSRQAAACM